MGKKSRKRLKSRQRPETTDTSFTACFIDDPELVRDICVLMVDNISDKERRKQEKESEEFDSFFYVQPDRTSGTGKPAALGLPGGGKNIENMESPLDAARNEYLQETGLELSYLEFLFVQGYLNLMKESRDEETGDKIMRNVTPPKPFEKGQRPPGKTGSGIFDVENYVHVYHGEISNWEDSNLRKILLEEKRLILADGFTQEDIDDLGILVEFESLSKKDLNSLNIKELNEIRGIGIFPLSYIYDAIKDKEKLNGFYWRHLKRVEAVDKILDGLDVDTIF